MGISAGPSGVSDGLVFQLDAANLRSYSGSGNTANGLVAGIGGTLVNGVGFGSTSNGFFIFLVYRVTAKFFGLLDFQSVIKRPMLPFVPITNHTLSGCPVYPNSGCPKTISVSINTHPLSLRSSM